MTALVGIDPKTKRCEIVGSNTTDTAEEIRKHGYIQVTLSKPKAREIWGEIVPDVYALAASNVEVRGAARLYRAASPGPQGYALPLTWVMSKLFNRPLRLVRKNAEKCTTPSTSVNLRNALVCRLVVTSSITL
jgi:hypothetical protein